MTKQIINERVLLREKGDATLVVGHFCELYRSTQSVGTVRGKLAP